MHLNAHTGWHTFTSKEPSYRYFNGRKYYVLKELRHYIDLSWPERNFSDHVVCVVLGARVKRFSRTTTRPRIYAPPS